MAVAYAKHSALMEIAMKFFEWHQTQTEWWLNRLGMTPYAALWFAYLKGVVTTIVVLWALGYV